MINSSEIKKLQSIKARALKNLPVSTEEKQWVLDIMRREHVPANSVKTLDVARKQGFDVKGVLAVNV